MTDTPLLRLARLLCALACRTDDGGHEAERIVRESAQLARDLEAAPETAQLFNCPTHFAWADPDCPACRAKQPPEPARRTITREEFNAARIIFLNKHITSNKIITKVAAAWRLTVEDA